MFESFVITLREGIEAALVIGILLVTLRSLQRKDLEKPIWWGVFFALVASAVMGFALMQFMEGYEETYEGVLYLASAFFVITMMWWMHRKSASLRSNIEKKLQEMTLDPLSSTRREKLGLGIFTFLMVFREGAETVAFLSAVTLKNTESVMAFLGGLAGVLAAVIFCVLFIRGTVVINLKRFFFVTQWILAIFVIQLLINGYHELAEAGLLPANQTTMATVGPIVKNNTLFLLAILALPLFIWLSSPLREGSKEEEKISQAQRRLAKSKTRRYRAYRYGAVFSLLFLLLLMGIVYAHEIIPRLAPPPQAVQLKNNTILIPQKDLSDGKLHHYGLLVEGKFVRLLAMKTPSGKYRAALDACMICGTKGYFQEGPNLICLNCSAEINPNTLGLSGGCNPIPLPSNVVAGTLVVPYQAVQQEAYRFEQSSSREVECPVCEMKFKLEKSSAFANYKGQGYFFCNMGHCKEKFLKTPERFVR